MLKKNARLGFGYSNPALRILLLLVVLSTPFGVGAKTVDADYQCHAFEEPGRVLGLDSGWILAKDGKIPLDRPGDTCWIRIKSLSAKDAGLGGNWLSFGDLNVQRVNITLFDAQGRNLGLAKRLGSSQGALVSGYRAMFPPDKTAPFPWYAIVAPIQGVMPIPGLAKNLLIESVSAADIFQMEQGEDLINQSGAVFLFTTALMALFFGLALRDLNYGIYALYATLQSLTIFTKSGLPFVLTASSPLWLNPWLFQYLVAMLSIVLCVRFGRFMSHSPKTVWLAYGVAMAFFLLIPLHFYAPDVGVAVVYALVPLHFLVLLSGNWRGWRQGERGCGILLIGLIPIAVYWAIFLFYQVFLHEPIPTEVALGSTFDFFRTLLLPLAFFMALQIEPWACKEKRHVWHCLMP